MAALAYLLVESIGDSGDHVVSVPTVPAAAPAPTRERWQRVAMPFARAFPSPTSS